MSGYEEKCQRLKFSVKLRGVPGMLPLTILSSETASDLLDFCLRGVLAECAKEVSERILWNLSSALLVEEGECFLEFCVRCRCGSRVQGRVSMLRGL